MKLIIQAHQTFAEFNDSSIAGLFLYPADVVDAFIPMILFAIFSITLLATFFGQQRLTGSGDFVSSFAVSSFFTAVISIVMSLVPNLIDGSYVVICVILAVFAFILLVSKKN